MSKKTDHLQLKAVKAPEHIPLFSSDLNCSVFRRMLPYGVIFATVATIQTIQRYALCD